MIQCQTCLKVADNSGAKRLMCIKVLGSNRKYGHVGDIIVGVVKEATPNLPVKRSNVVRAVIVRTKQPVRRLDGSRVRFEDNACIVLGSENNPRGTRVFGPVARELREKEFTRIVSLASEVL